MSGLRLYWLIRRAAGLAALGVMCLSAVGAQAAGAASNTAVTDQGTVRLVAAATATGKARTVRLGLHIRMKPGWKVYWRSPGPGGFPPDIDWSGSQNLAGAEMKWPVPERFSILGFESLGYEHEVVYPIIARLKKPGEPLGLKADLRYLTCRKICVPHEMNLALSLPAGPATASPDAHLIDRYLARVPGQGTAAGLSIERVTVAGARKSPTLRVYATARGGFDKPDVFIEGPDLFEFAAPKVAIGPDGKSAVLTVGAGAAGDDAPPLVGERLTLTLADGDRAVQRTLVAAAAGGSSATGAQGLLVVLGFALLGGLILNLMPCVLPVLSIKLLGLVGHGGARAGRVRLRFLASSAGILSVFMLLAAATIAVKAAGVAVGWGIQFQQPLFLVFMVVVLTLFAANMWGLFEIRLPEAIADIGAHAGRHDGIGGDFLTGALATLLATPCTAPFLGTAVGFALARGPTEIVAVFAALGVGLALPYLAVAAVPQAATWLPAPGPWMIRLKQVLAFALVATAVWLLTVLAVQTGIPAAVAVGALMVAGLGLLWLGHARGHGSGPRWPIPAAIAAVALLALAAPYALPRGTVPAPAGERAAASGRTVWRPFDEGAIPALVSRGKTVFVDVTADWCITCQANKSLVLNRNPVAARLSSGNVVAMVADWTRPDPVIADYLSRYGRYGIPFNIIYGPGARGGIPLPELLTSEAVMRAFDKAEREPETAAKP